MNLAAVPSQFQYRDLEHQEVGGSKPCASGEWSQKSRSGLLDLQNTTLTICKGEGSAQNSYYDSTSFKSQSKAMHRLLIDPFPEKYEPAFQAFYFLFFENKMPTIVKKKQTCDQKWKWIWAAFSGEMRPRDVWQILQKDPKIDPPILVKEFQKFVYSAPLSLSQSTPSIEKIKETINLLLTMEYFIQQEISTIVLESFALKMHTSHERLDMLRSYFARIHGRGLTIIVSGLSSYREFTKIQEELEVLFNQVLIFEISTDDFVNRIKYPEGEIREEKKNSGRHPVYICLEGWIKTTSNWLLINYEDPPLNFQGSPWVMEKPTLQGLQ
jgi:hypothetical protein